MRPYDPLFSPILSILHLPLATSRSLPTHTIDPRDPTFPEPTPPPSRNLAQSPSCALVSQALSICAVLTPGFVTLLPPQQAHCLCYSSTLWAPYVLDDAVKTCADFASTAAPGAFPPLRNLEGFCLGVGDVDSSAPASVQATSSSFIPVMGAGGMPGSPTGGLTGLNYLPPSMPTYVAGNENGANGGQDGSGDGGNGTGNNHGSINDGSGSTGVSENNGSSCSASISIPSSTSSSGGHGSASSTDSLTPISTMSSSLNDVSTLTTTSRTSVMGLTITVINGDAPATQTAAGAGAVRNRGEVTETEVVLVSLAIASLILFL
ncbi:uncharacterized protein RAG0_09947 [Rhynchosporium agropyri]|uniref:Uncharacterized protein n=1 Tax=Rhynchosporium agropyri TaxID=914238 RepID=A0A1E1KXU3_9HELO|nr:uncharacterized protein RAG0_09947 [Rhynchosporium agropyri]